MNNEDDNKEEYIEPENLESDEIKELEPDEPEELEPDEPEELEEEPHEEFTPMNNYQGNNRFGEREHNAAKQNGHYDNKYYANRQKELDKKVEEAKNEKDRNFKMTKDHEDEKIKADGSNTKNKNFIDKTKDKINYGKAKNDQITNKIANAKDKAFKINHPEEMVKEKVEDIKDKAKEKVKETAKEAGKKVAKGASQGLKVAGKAIVSFLKTPQGMLLLVIIGIVALVLLFILLLVGGVSDESDSSYMDSTCNFNDTTVNFSSCNSNDTPISMTLADYVKGVTYAYIKNNHFTDEQIKAMMIIIKTNALSMGSYDNTTKSVILNDCNIHYEDLPLNNSYTTKLDKFYDVIANYIYVSKTYDAIIQTLGSVDELNFDSNIINAISDTGNMSYQSILNHLYNTPDHYHLYNLNDYCLHYNLAENDLFWWPIGSLRETAPNIYGGPPANTLITSFYGHRNLQGSSGLHKGYDLAGTCRSTVVIAAKSGKVITANDLGCASNSSLNDNCGGGYGNHIQIDHGDGVSTFYGHLYANSLAVKVGDVVKQGQKIALVGSSGRSTGCHLHFEVRINNSQVDPGDYIDPNNPRPVSSFNFAGGYGNTPSGKQGVCQALLKSGISKNATIGILINLMQESGCQSNNLEGCYESGACCLNGTYGYCKHPEIGQFGSDEAYTQGVDSGAYSRDKFINDHAGYGLVQWTYKNRKANLYDYIKSKKVSIADTSAQLEYMIEKELPGYPQVYEYIKGNYAAKDIALTFCRVYEKPANLETECQRRVNQYLNEFTSFVNNNCN